MRIKSTREIIWAMQFTGSVERYDDMLQWLRDQGFTSVDECQYLSGPVPKMLIPSTEEGTLVIFPDQYVWYNFLNLECEMKTAEETKDLAAIII